MDIVVDVMGYYSTATSAGSEFVVCDQIRLIDSREGLGVPQAKLSAGQTINIAMTGRGPIPSSNVTALVLNLTATGASTTTRMTMWPTGSSRPGVSNIQAVNGRSTANQVTVPVSSGGSVSIYNFAGQVDFILDLQGYYRSTSSGTGATYVPVAPSTMYRSNGTATIPVGATKLSAASTKTIQVTGEGVIPATDVAAVQLTVEANNPSGSGFLKVFPTPVVSGAAPTNSNVNFSGSTAINSASVGVSSAGTVDVSMGGTGTADLVVTVVGYFLGSTPPTQPENVTAIAGRNQVYLKWRPPTMNGRSPITKYTVTASPGGKVATTNGAREIEMNGLSNGITYTFAVVATNGVADGPAATSGPATPDSNAPPVISSGYFSEDVSTPYLERGTSNDHTFKWKNFGGGISEYRYTLDGGVVHTTTEKGINWFPNPGDHAIVLRPVAFGVPSPNTRTFTFTVLAPPAPEAPSDPFESDLDTNAPLLTALVNGAYSVGTTVDLYMWDSNGVAIGQGPIASGLVSAGSRAALRVEPALLPSNQQFSWATRSCVKSACSTVTPRRAVTMLTTVPAPETLTLSRDIQVSALRLSQTGCDQACASSPTNSLRIGTDTTGRSWRSTFLMPALGVPVGSTIVAARLELTDPSSVDAPSGYVSFGAPDGWQPPAIAANTPDLAENDILAGQSLSDLSLLGYFERAEENWLDAARTILIEPRGSGYLEADSTASFVVEYQAPQSVGPVRDLRVFAADGAVVAGWAGPSRSAYISLSYRLALTSPTGVVVYEAVQDNPTAVIGGLQNGHSYTVSVTPITPVSQGIPTSVTATPAALVQSKDAIAAASTFLLALNKLDAGARDSTTALAGSALATTVSAALVKEAPAISSIQRQFEAEDPVTAAAEVPALSDVAVAQVDSKILVFAQVDSNIVYTPDAAESIQSTNHQNLVLQFADYNSQLTLVGRMDMRSYLIRADTLGAVDIGTDQESPIDGDVEPASLDEIGSAGPEQDTQTGVMPLTDFTSTKRGAASKWARNNYTIGHWYSDNCMTFVSRTLKEGGKLPSVARVRIALSPGVPSPDSTKNWFTRVYKSGRVIRPNSRTFSASQNFSKFIVTQRGSWVNSVRKTSGGDVILYDWIYPGSSKGDGRMDHASIVTVGGTSTTGPYITQQSTDRKDYPLLKQISENRTQNGIDVTLYGRRILGIAP